MMMKLKGFLYGRYVKQLFIISLISFFGLLGSSFVNSEWIFQNVGTAFTVSGQSTYTLNARPSGAGIVEGAGVIVPAFYVPKRWSSYQYYSLFYYNTDGYMVKNSFQNNYPSQGGVYQVVFDSFYLTTPENLSSCTSAFPCGGVSTNYDSYKNNSNYKGQMTRFAYYYSSNSNYESSICLIFDSFDSAFCFYNNQNFIAVNGLTNNPAEFDTSLVGTSPWVSNTPSNTGNLNPDSEKIYYSDNNQVYYDTYKAIGFNSGLCYSNFLTSDIVDSNTNYYDLFPSALSPLGASVFDLYDDWFLPKINPFNAWYSWYSSRYNKLNQNPSNSNLYGLYSGVSKGNYYIFDKLFNNEFIESYSLCWKDYYTFCDMTINGYDPDGAFTGQTCVSFDNIFTSSPCIRNGTCISDEGQFFLSGANDDGYFSGSAGIIDVFNSLYSQFRNAFKVDSSLSGTTGILPTYIIFGFFLFVLFYIFKK